MSEEGASPRVPEAAGESTEERLFCGDDLAPMWHRAESRSSQWTEGERGRGHLWDRHGRRPPACLFLSQMVPESDGTEADFHLSQIHV